MTLEALNKKRREEAEWELHQLDRDWIDVLVINGWTGEEILQWVLVQIATASGKLDCQTLGLAYGGGQDD